MGVRISYLENILQEIASISITTCIPDRIKQNPIISERKQKFAHVVPGPLYAIDCCITITKFVYMLSGHDLEWLTLKTSDTNTYQLPGVQMQEDIFF